VKLVKYLACIAVLGASISPVFAAEFGRSTVNGKKIILYKNGTWKLAPRNTSRNCTEIRSKKIPMSVCLSESSWKSRLQNFDFEYGFLSKGPEEVYAGLITEKAYIEKKVLKKALLLNANSGANLAGVKILKESSRVFNGQTWSQIEYALTMKEGLSVVYLNIYGSKKGKGSVQFILWALAEEVEAVRRMAETVSLKFD
tara:strand:+ start:213 stop:809 length:597 start_codon:yes stop_codon:yes gene_type:complete